MGGSIRVVTKIDGVIHKQTRWTNMLPDFVKNPGFITGNKEYVQAYLDRVNSEDKENQTISPYDYGLDVFDFDAKILWTMQNYCSYIDIDTVLLSMWYNDNYCDYNGEPFDHNSADFYPNVVQAMWDAGYIKVRGYTGTKEEPWDASKEYFLTKEQVKLSMEECYLIMAKKWDVSHKRGVVGYFNDLCDKLLGKEAEQPQPQILNFVIDWEAAGWTIKEYDVTVDGAKAYMQDLQVGMLVDEDIKEWQEWILEREENEV